MKPQLIMAMSANALSATPREIASLPRRPKIEKRRARVGLVDQKSFTTLLPIMAVVFSAYLVIGFAMPVLPLHVHQGLGFGTFVVGLVAGSQFAAALISRMWAGHYADRRGAKNAVVTGLLVAALSGAF